MNIKSPKDQQALVFMAFLFPVWAAHAAHEIDAYSRSILMQPAEFMLSFA